MSVASSLHRVSALGLVPLLLGGLVLTGCSTSGLPAVSGGPAPDYDYFERPSASDPWTPKIVGWQLRERAQPPAAELVPAAPAVSDGDRARTRASATSLRERYSRFRAESRRALARDLAEWMQSVAKRHYVPDGLVDHWATLKETLDRNGDDCDGLELLAFHFLRDHGFGEDEVFRAVVYRPSDGQHHMVTLWFEDPRDPWVIDPTGAMTEGMPRMSERPDWVPLKLFTDSESFTVRRADEARGETRWAGVRR
jgi:hypothetical protein